MGEHISNYLCSHNSSLDEYVAELRQPGTWADHVAIIGLATALHRRIKVISSSGQDYDTEALPQDGRELGVPIYIGHIPEVHYLSLPKKKFLQLNKCPKVTISPTGIEEIGKKLFDDLFLCKYGYHILLFGIKTQINNVCSQPDTTFAVRFCIICMTRKIL